MRDGGKPDDAVCEIRRRVLGNKSVGSMEQGGIGKKWRY